MDPESQKLLEETLVLEKENNYILRKIRSVQKWSALWILFKVLVIFGIAFGSFYFLEPFINKIINVWDSMNGLQQQENGTPVQDFLKKFSN
ncbi:MAG TPA: hypothetical protein VJH06_02710 [Candidatus Paceibacterota bacterium]